jgi:hypothetical protein
VIESPYPSSSAEPQQLALIMAWTIVVLPVPKARWPGVWNAQNFRLRIR